MYNNNSKTLFYTRLVTLLTLFFCAAFFVVCYLFPSLYLLLFLHSSPFPLSFLSFFPTFPFCPLPSSFSLSPPPLSLSLCLTPSSPFPLCSFVFLVPSILSYLRVVLHYDLCLPALILVRFPHQYFSSLTFLNGLKLVCATVRKLNFSVFFTNNLKSFAVASNVNVNRILFCN